MTLESRPFGATGETVTTLGYGAMELRSDARGPAIDAEDAGRLLNAVLDGGITFIDTSIDYGKSEELIGKFIGHRRDEYFLASKCGCLVAPPTDQTPLFPHDFGRENVRAGVEQSLVRLHTDRIDLVQVHLSPSRDTLEHEGTVEELWALRDEGKIRFIGISGTLPNLPDQLEMGVFDAFQIPYSALQREHEELIANAAAAGAGTVIRGGVARGAPAEGKAWVDPIGLAKGEGERRWQTAELDAFLEDMTSMEFVLRFTLSHPGLSTTIVGTSKIDHFKENLAAAEKGPLPSNVYEQAKERLAKAGSIPGGSYHRA